MIAASARLLLQTPPLLLALALLVSDERTEWTFESTLTTSVGKAVGDRLAL